MKTTFYQTLYFLVAFITIVFSSCASLFEPAAPPPEKYRPSFDYMPIDTARARSAEISIALVNPRFADTKNQPALDLAPYKTFVSNMGNDFEELLTAKGFSIRGPFVSRDEMLHGDKRNSDLVLHIEISLENEGQLNAKRYGYNGQYTQAYYKVSGTFYHIGTMNLTVTNPISGEKFWRKSVELPRKAITCVGVSKFIRIPNNSEALEDVGIYNPIAKALEEYYLEALSLVSRHIDVEEFKHIAKEIKEANQY